MSAVQLNKREQLIERILRMPDDQIAAAAMLLESLHDDPAWSDEGITAAELARRNVLDLAAAEATRGEPTMPLDDVLRELGIQA